MSEVLPSADALELGEEVEFVATRPSAPTLSLVALAPPLAEVEEEETEFVSPHEISAKAELPELALEEEPPPFDPPDAEDLIGATQFHEDDAPFDPPDDLNEFLTAIAAPALEPAQLANENAAPRPLTRQPDEVRPSLSAPPISVHISWDRAHSSELAGALCADRRMARADISHGRGGLDGAIVRFAKEQSPDLLIIDTTLSGVAMFRAIDRLVKLIDPKTKLIVIGAVNDVGLFRELSQRGVSEYVLTPASPEQLVDAACRLFAETDSSHVIAVIGARGGVGASTIARNIAWSIAEEHQMATALVDLDWSFGTAAFDSLLETPRSIADALAVPDDEGAPDRVAVYRTERLRILSSPASLQKEDQFDPEDIEALIRRVRRLSSFVILDLPHTWAPWIKRALVAADDVVMVASPDLASLRNAEAILRAVKNGRAGRNDPLVTLSMVGMPKRPEIALKDFAEALSNTPVESLSFDPALFGEAIIRGQMLAEVAPGSRASISITKLTSLITGHEPIQRKSGNIGLDQSANPAASAEVQHESNGGAGDPTPLDLVEPAPPPADYIVKARRAAEAELVTPSRNCEEQEPLIRFPIGVAKFAVCAVALGFGWLWYDQSEPSLAVVEPASAEAVTLPAPQLANDFALRYETALQLIEDGDTEPGVALLEEIAAENHAPSQHRLARMYEAGDGVAADPARARLWTERAAVAGNVLAMHDMGVYLARGADAPADEVAAFRWFRQAAEFNYADSQFNLGVLYQQGRGVSASAEEALFWFMLAARQGDAGAAERAGMIEMQMETAELERVLARVLAFSPRAPNTQANVTADLVQAATEAPAEEPAPS